MNDEDRPAGLIVWLLVAAAITVVVGVALLVSWLS